MKLISMVNFILQFDKPVGYLEDQSDFLHCQVDYMGKAMSYAKLLKKPLKLEMFVPCDEDGDILDEPEDYELRLTNMMTEYNDEVYRYKQAKEKVLFEGFELVRFIEKENPCYVVSNGENEITFHIGLYNFSKGVRFANTIEDLIHIQPILTESAIKQIGL